MSDLQCPARFLVVGGAEASLAEALRHERVAAVYDGRGNSAGSGGPGAPAGPGRTGAERLAQRLGVPHQVMPDGLAVADVLAGQPAAMSSLRELADLHRGETAVVAAAGAPGSRVDVSVDGDGTTVVEVSPGDAR